MKQTLPVVPVVAEFESAPGSCSISHGICLSDDTPLQTLTPRLRRAWQWLSQDVGLPDGGSIPCSLQRGASEAGRSTESYELQIEPDAIRIKAAGEAGIFYAIQSLRQLIAGHGPQEGLACGTIRDTPRFPWRGSMVDSARHFQPISWIKEHLDRMAALKLNRLHWHLTDDQAWRPEISCYPLLTEEAAWRRQDGRRYGGWFSQTEMREVVEYARRRFITVIPEIEMPGHCNAALVAYPELSCTGEPLPIAADGWDAYTRDAGRRAFCAGNSEVYRFLENVLQEINRVFDPPYLHIGGDETPRDQWDRCPHCKKLRQEARCADSAALRVHFIQRIDRFCQEQLGKRTIAWTEGVSDQLPQDQVVHAWFPGEAARAARLGYQVINSNHEWTYLDYPATRRDATRKPDWMIVLPLEKTYHFDPLPDGLDSTHAEMVLGGEAPIWTEHAPDASELERQLMPRLAALAEAFWSPRTGRSFDDFLTRLKRQQQVGTLVAASPAVTASHGSAAVG